MQSIDRSDFFNTMLPTIATWMTWFSVGSFLCCSSVRLITAMSVVSVQRSQYYRYALSTESVIESEVASIYACLPFLDSDELRFKHCTPGLCTDSSEYLLDSRVKIEIFLCVFINYTILQFISFFQRVYGDRICHCTGQDSPLVSRNQWKV